ncbi:Protein TRANSPARENT TESTA 12 [Hordeum vulgare]|nr:Protein TRANSPARENT TESTA 12 [Hordeum vulgare]
MLSSGATAVSHVVVCWALVYRLRLGIRGAALANAVSYLTNVSILAVYVRVSPSCKKSWTGFSLQALHGLLPFLKLARQLDPSLPELLMDSLASGDRLGEGGGGGGWENPRSMFAVYKG